MLIAKECMSKKSFKLHKSLIITAIASSVFLPALGFATTQITTSLTGPISTAGTGGIEITESGEVVSTGFDGIIVNSPNPADNIVTIDANNTSALLAIEVTGTGSGINILNPAAQITINTGSGITTDGDGVLIASNNANISNFGTVTSGAGAAAPGSAIEITPLGTNATIINQTSSSLLSDIAAIVPTVLVNGTGLTLTNSGIINGTAPGAVGVNAIVLNASFNSITNLADGVITTSPAGVTTILAANNITGSIINSGDILGIGGNAIDLASAGANINVPITQNGGTITGNILVSSLGGVNAFTMNSGIVDGNVNDTNAAIANTLNLLGGQIFGNVLLGSHGDTVNLGGTTLQAITGGAGADTINVTGGLFTSLTGGGGADILNINAPFSTNASITAIPTINVNNLGTVFTINSPMPFTALNVNSGASLIAYANLTGGAGSVLTNNGTVVITPGNAISTNTFTQNAGGTYSPVLTATGPNGVLNVATAATLNANSFIAPLFGPLIPNGSTFNVINSAGALVDNATLVNNSAVVTFTSNIVGTFLQLTANRNSLDSLASNANTHAVARVLDVISHQPISTVDPDLLNLFNQLDHLPTSDAVNQALQSLLPPLNYSEIGGALLSMTNVFNTVGTRFEIVHRARPLGFNSGDIGYDPPTGTWIKLFASTLNQNEMSGIDGYDATAVGGIIGTEWDICDFFGIGFAASYAAVELRDKAFIPKDQHLSSYQGTFYGWYEPIPNWFVDTILSGAGNHYQSYHHIAVGNLVNTAIGDFDGSQFAGQVDFGYAMIQDRYYFSPLVRMRYSYIELDSYSEKTLGGLDLAVQEQVYHEFLIGLGARAAAQFIFCDIIYTPEASAFILYDIENDGQQSIATFTGGGPAFATNGLIPNPTMFDLGLSLNAEQNNAIFTLKYDFQTREKMINNTLSLQGYYYW